MQSEQRTPLIRSEVDSSLESMGRASILATLFKSEKDDEEEAEADLPDIFSSVYQMRSVMTGVSSWHTLPSVIHTSFFDVNN